MKKKIKREITFFVWKKYAKNGKENDKFIITR